MSLSRAIATPYPEYEVMGLYDGEERIQLNTNILQIENEFYSPVRPKRVTQSGERPTMVMRPPMASRPAVSAATESACRTASTPSSFPADCR